MPELWTPNGGDGALGIIVAGAKVRRSCEFCGAKFYATGDDAADDRRFLIHHEACYRKRGEDMVGEALHRRMTEPLHVHDAERERHRRRKAEERRDKLVKASSAWDPKLAELYGQRTSKNLRFKRRAR